MSKANVYKIIGRCGMLLALGTCLMPAISMAQQYYDPGLRQDTVHRRPVPYQSSGIRMGSFLLNPGVDIGWEYNDNVFYSEKGGVSDSILRVRPWANLSSDWSRHELNLNAYADIGRYADFDSENYTDWTASMDGRFDVKRRSAFNYGATYRQMHEDRSSPDDVRGVEPTKFNVGGYELGYSHTFNRLQADLDWRDESTSYDNNRDDEGNIISSRDRNRSRDAVALRLGYGISPQSNVFVSGHYNNVDYDQRFTDDGYQRSSDGYGIQGGMAFDITGLLTGDLYLQYLSQSYDDPRFGDVDGFGFGAGLEWTPTKLTDVNFRFSNTPQETTQSGTSGYYSSLYSVRVQHELRRNLLANARVSYTDNDYQTNGQDAIALKSTSVTRLEVGMNYLVNRHVTLSGGYSYDKQSANNSDYNYNTNRWFLILGLEL